MAKPFLHLTIVLLSWAVGFLGAMPAVVWASNTSSSETIITLKISGWTCASCEKDIRKSLMDIPGVRSAEVSYARGGAIVTVEPGKIDSRQLVQAVRGASSIFDTYQATVVPNGSLSNGEPRSGLFENFWSSLFGN